MVEKSGVTTANKIGATFIQHMSDGLCSCGCADKTPLADDGSALEYERELIDMVEAAVTARTGRDFIALCSNCGCKLTYTMEFKSKSEIPH